MNSYQAGQKLLCGGYTSFTVDGKAYFVRAGRWHKDPLPGDIVYFFSKAKNRVAHVGLVTKVERIAFGKIRITTVEGNTSAGKYFSRDGGCVALKTYVFSPSEVGGGHLIDGFGRPRYGADTCTAEELIEVALGEVGYVEKASASQLESKTGNPGDKNFTRYGAWYGMNGVYWCAEFTSWCAYTACAKHRENAYTGWQQKGSAWQYIDENGTLVAGRWKYIGGRWYVFDNAGNLIRDTWFQDAAGWYYLAGDGGMLSGQWLEYQGAQYYLTQTGLMAKDAYVRGAQPSVGGAPYYYYVDSEGRWDSTRDTEQLPAGAEVAI